MVEVDKEKMQAAHTSPFPTHLNLVDGDGKRVDFQNIFDVADTVVADADSACLSCVHKILKGSPRFEPHLLSAI